MARKFILQNLIKLAQSIGANQSKFTGTRSNISFLGKGPTKNPLFQGPVAGIEKEAATGAASGRAISAIEDAMGYATDGKLNDIQLKALTLNMEKLNKALYPTLPTRGSGIAGFRNLRGNETFDELLEIEKDRKELNKALYPVMPTQAPGITGSSKAFMGWTPKVVPKKWNPTSSKVNHQMIADHYGIDVELIKGKNWEEVLEVIRKLGYADGGLANVMQTPRRGRVVHPGGYAGSKRQAFIDLARRGGSRQDFIDLALSFKESPVMGISIHDMLMSGALPSELKNGGLAEILAV